jgi:hypothetical protein
MEFARPRYPVQRCLTPFFGISSSGAGSTKTPTDPSPIVSSLASSGGRNSVENSLYNGPGEDSGISDHSGTGEIVPVIYDQYYTPPPLAQPSSSAQGHQSMNVQNVNPRSSGTRRANTDFNLRNMDHRLYSPKNDAPQASLPDLQRAREDNKHSSKGHDKGVLNFSRPVLSVQSVPSHQDVTSVSDGTSQASQDFVIYGRLPPQPGQETSSDQSLQESDGSQRRTSNAGLSTDSSDEDPFKYDRGSFTVFLQPSREREVSAALRCVSSDSTASASGLLHLSSLPEPVTPCGFQSNNPFANKLHTYQTPIAGYDWDDEHGPNEVKISVVRSPPPVPPNSPVQQPMNLSEFVEGLGSQRRRKEIHTLMSDGADWETVATSVGQFDSNRALASSTGLSGSHLVKVTGSSIADYSDTSSVHVPQFDAFSSTERILEHTTTSYAPCRRILNDPRRPVFLPKPRIHRVNGYLQNSRRLFTDTTNGSSGNSVRSALVDKLTASIRSRSARKQAYRQNHPNMERWSKSNFKSLESLSSTYSEQPGAMDESHEAAGSARENDTSTVNGCEQQGQETTFGLVASPIPREPDAVHLKGHKAAHSDQAHGFESPTLFSFPLISLQEAAQRAAIRAGNDDNLTVTTGARTRKNSSMDSSKATQRTTPPTPHITKPVRAHSRRPTSASILGITLSHPGDSQGTQTPNYHRFPSCMHCTDHNCAEKLIMGHDRGPSNVTSYKSATPLIAARSALSRPLRNPFEPAGTSLRNSGAYPGTHIIFNSPPRLVPRDKRNAARALAGTMSPDLRQLAALEAGASFGALADDVYLSWEARKRRQMFYYGLCILAAVPFISPLIWRGKFDSALSWFTRGETGSLTAKQKKTVDIIGIAFWGVWLVAIAVIFTIAIQQAREAQEA